MIAAIRYARRDVSLSAVVAGLVAVLISYAGPVLIVVQTARATHLPEELLSSWVWAISMGAGLLGLYLSLRYRTPVIGAWSTPGVALLMVGLTQYSFAEVVGCYVVLALAVTVLGFTGLFSRLMDLLPQSLLSAMIAGVLLPFCLKVFQSAQSSAPLVVTLLLAYLIGRRFIPRYAVALALLAGLASALLPTAAPTAPVNLSWARPVFTAPVFRVPSLVGLGLPLLVLAMTQYATGIAVLRNAGYALSPSRIVAASGLVSLPLAFFGSSGLNPAAIIGALCASPEAHEDPEKRYIAGVSCGLGYLVMGSFGASVVALLSLLPGALIATIAGLALFGTLGAGLHTALADERQREASLIVFLVTASGVSFLGLGSALWGLTAGLMVMGLMNWKPRSRP